MDPISNILAQMPTEPERERIFLFDNLKGKDEHFIAIPNDPLYLWSLDFH